MAIIIPTIDDFDENTIMRMLRKLIGWIKDDLIEQINNNDIVSVNKEVDGMTFDINLVKGDGTTIPVGEIVLTDEDNIESAELEFDNNTRMLSGKFTKANGEIIDIADVNIPAGTQVQTDYAIDSIVFTYSDNNLSCKITQNDGTVVDSNTIVITGGSGTGGNPYPTAITGSVGSDGNINLNITMSEGQPLTATINMAYFASAEDLEDIQTQLTAITISTTVAQDSTNVIKVSNAVNGNSADLKLDLAVVGTDIVLTAENADGTQQATTKIAVGDIPFDNSVYLYNIDGIEQYLYSIFNKSMGLSYTSETRQFASLRPENICYKISNVIIKDGVYCQNSNIELGNNKTGWYILKANTYYTQPIDQNCIIKKIINNNLINYTNKTANTITPNYILAKNVIIQENNISSITSQGIFIIDVIIRLTGTPGFKIANNMFHNATNNLRIIMTDITTLEFYDEEPTFD